MAKITVEIEVADELSDSDKYGIEDAVADALRNLGYNVRSVEAEVKDA